MVLVSFLASDSSIGFSFSLTTCLMWGESSLLIGLQYQKKIRGFWELNIRESFFNRSSVDYGFLLSSSCQVWMKVQRYIRRFRNNENMLRGVHSYGIFSIRSLSPIMNTLFKQTTQLNYLAFHQFHLFLVFLLKQSSPLVLHFHSQLDIVCLQRKFNISKTYVSNFVKIKEKHKCIK